MSNFQNTEQTYSVSGISANFPAPNPSLAVSRNSGGMVNVSGSMMVKAIYIDRVSGFTGASNSGCLIVIGHSASGLTSGGGTAGSQDILLFHYGGSSGVSLDVPPITNLDFFARSGLSTFVGNSGFTNAYTARVFYAYKQF